MTSRSLLLALPFLLSLAVLRPAPAGPAAVSPPPPVSFDRDEVTVVSGGTAHRLHVGLAVTPEQRARGLMFRDALPPDAGMLFLFGEEKVVAMWMKDTQLPLDLLFLGPDGRILKVAEGARPLSLNIISSDVPAWAVLEVAGGAAHALGLTAGDRVVHRAFAPAR